MVKLIIEVSEEYIRTNSEIECVEKKARDNEKRGGAIKALFDMIAFSQIAKEIDKGNSEFVVSREKLQENAVELFDKTVGEICMMATMIKDDKAGGD